LLGTGRREVTAVTGLFHWYLEIESSTSIKL
jgi:hypothetical protein